MLDWRAGLALKPHVDQFVSLVREHYSDFGPTLACEYLAAQHG